MGYEVTLYIGTVRDIPSLREDNAVYFQDVAMVELCNPGYDSETYKLSNNNDVGGTKIYMYGLDGNTQFTEDWYGKKLTAFEPEIVLKALEKDKRTKYRRFIMAYELLRKTIQLFPDENLKVVLFGN